MRRFAATDLEELNRWHAARGLNPLRAGLLSDFGLLEPGVACGFLFGTDSEVCFLDGYLSNPDARKTSVHRALGAITAALLVEAKRRGFTVSVALTQRSGISALAKKHGFRSIGAREMLTVQV